MFYLQAQCELSGQLNQLFTICSI